MRLPTPEALDNSGPLRVNLGPGGHFETYAKDLDHYYFNVTGDSFNIDIIDLKFWGHQASSVTPTSSGITIHLTNGNSLNLNGSFPGVQWREGVEGGIEIFACFAEGTFIQTPDGNRRVEELAVGDAVITQDGPRQINWVGHKTLNLHGAVPDESLLVHIRPHAFGDQQPARDLWITSEHCVWVAGAMIPVRCLINDSSITHERDRLHYTYYHFTLSEYAVIYAENLPRRRATAPTHRVNVLMRLSPMRLRSRLMRIFRCYIRLKLSKMSGQCSLRGLRHLAMVVMPGRMPPLPSGK